MVNFATKLQCRRLSISAFLDSSPSNCTMLPYLLSIIQASYPRSPLVNANTWFFGLWVLLITPMSYHPTPRLTPSPRSVLCSCQISMVPSPPLNLIQHASIIDPQSAPPPIPALNVVLPRACSFGKATKDTTVFRFLQESEGTCILHIIAGANTQHFPLQMLNFFAILSILLYLPIKHLLFQNWCMLSLCSAYFRLIRTSKPLQK
ncbi:hypothetical protein JVT61DRAFT_9920 [Boletus reticuloceps]|uniref:Uncharacterized protein n=1 Tax=Boletus reticuloceps TaxID=495285 RepID=A0A8I2YFT6_9AGAM|nr:hypothetical protein JVT61DRAFT_9920 [Boletus reticuloceps]